MTRTTGTTETLRAHLFSELESLKSGKISIQRATASYKIAGQILNAARLDLEHYKLIKTLEGKNDLSPVSAVSLIG